MAIQCHFPALLCIWLIWPEAPSEMAQGGGFTYQHLTPAVRTLLVAQTSPGKPFKKKRSELFVSPYEWIHKALAACPQKIRGVSPDGCSKPSRTRSLGTVPLSKASPPDLSPSIRGWCPESPTSRAGACAIVWALVLDCWRLNPGRST